MEAESNVELRLVDFLKVVKKRFYIIIAVTVIIVSLTAIYDHFIVKPLYVAKISFVIKNKSDDPLKGFQYSDLVQLAKTFSSLAKTTNVAGKAIDKLGIKMSPDDLLKNTTATPELDTPIIDLAVTDSSKTQAKNLINALSSSFIQEASLIYSEQDVKVIDSDKGVLSSIESNKSTNILIAFGISIMLSILIIALMEYIDDTLKSEEDVQAYLHLPIMGIIPSEKHNLDKIYTNISEYKYQKFLEAYKMLGMNTIFMCKNKGIKTLTVTSSTLKAGNTITASMMSAVIAQAGEKTLLVDCDLRDSKVNKLFDLNESIGLSNVILGQNKLSEVVKKSKIDHLYILPSGCKSYDPSQMLSSSIMLEILDKLKEEYDYIVIDTPPVGVFSDAQIIAQITDACVFVISSGKTGRKVAIRAMKLLEYSNAKMIGICLNGLKDINTKYSKHNAKKNKSKNSNKTSLVVDQNIM